MKTILKRWGKPAKEVKNLGWLLNNWQEVLRFEILKGKNDNECQLTAILKDGGYYMTDFASFVVCLGFLDRPIFRTSNLDIIKSYNSDVENFKIGNEEYRNLIIK